MQYKTTNRMKRCSAIFILMLSFLSCTYSQKNVNAETETPLPPNTDYSPAFVGQNRAKTIVTTTPYKVEKLAEKLGRPWAIIPFPGNKLLISDKSGFLQLIGIDGSGLKKVVGLPPVVNKSQGGLLDIALDPDFETNRLLYWSFSEGTPTSNLTAVAKGTLSTDETTIVNPVVIFRALPALSSNLHFGSRLVFDKEGFLYVSTGERSNLDGRPQAQWLNSGLGKIFKITKDGQPAPGNPFLNQPNTFPEMYSFGHRNPQSLDLHPMTGELWECEFGPRGGDEVNVIVAGKNYGWPIITYGIEYIGGKVGDGIQQKQGMEQPVYYWDPVVSPSGMVFYTGNQIPEWKNNLFISGLSSMRLIRLVIENHKVVGEERLLGDKNERFRDVAQLDGALYTVTDNGNLYKVSKQ